MGRYQEGPNGEGKSPHLQYLRPVHRSMARAVALGNLNPKKLKEIYGFTESWISCIMGSPLFQVEVQRIENELELVSMDMAKDLKLMGEQAIQNLDEDLHIDPTTSLDHRKHRSNTSLEILGMLGIRKTGSSINVNKFLQVNHFEKKVEDLEEQEIREEVMELIQGEAGVYE